MAQDLTLNTSAFLGAPNPTITASNRNLIKMQGTIPQWFEIGAEKYRQMRRNGQTPFPAPVYLESSQDLPLPSRDAGRTINCRLLLPEGQKQGQQPGVYMHVHGGGWVLQSEKDQDPFLQKYANATGLAVLSVGYRLAPEHPFPAGPNDCYDIAEYLVDHAPKEFGGPLLFIGGESAGGHLSALTVIHLLQARPDFRLRGTVLTYGAFNLSTHLPATQNWKLPLVLPSATMDAYYQAFVPDMSAEDRAHPSVSPMYAPIFHIKDEESQEGVGAKNLPPAFFACGTCDPLVDDTILMSARWQMAGAEAQTKIFKGMPHGFNLFPDSAFPGSQECLDLHVAWMKKHMKA